MNTFLTLLVRQDHSLQLAAHLAAGILSLVLLTGAAQPRPNPPAEPAAQVLEARVALAPTLIVAATP